MKDFKEIRHEASSKDELDEARSPRPPKLKGNDGPYTRRQIEKAAKEAKVDTGAISRMMMALRKMNESVELDEAKTIKIVADTNSRKYKEGEVIKTFPETDKGLTQAMTFQKTVKGKLGIDTKMIREAYGPSAPKMKRSRSAGSGGDKYVVKYQGGKNTVYANSPDDALKKSMKFFDVGPVGKDRYMRNATAISELSIDTMKSYRQKAADDVAKNKKPEQRTKGAVRATGKIYKKELGNLHRKEETDVEEMSTLTKMKAKIARGVRGPSKKATPAMFRQTGKAGKKNQDRLQRAKTYELGRRARQK